MSIFISVFLVYFQLLTGDVEVQVLYVCEVYCKDKVYISLKAVV